MISLSKKFILCFSVTVSENVPVRRSRRIAHMDVNGDKLPSPEGSDNEMDTTEVNRYDLIVQIKV